MAIATAGPHPVKHPKRWWAHLRTLERHELEWLLVGLGLCVLVTVFMVLASQVSEGDTQAFDVHVLSALRNAADPSRPIGPIWIGSVIQDITALGGPTVLSLVVLAVIGFLALQSRYRTALFVLATTVTGEIVSYVLKHTFNRARPTVIPNMRIMSPSFPSGHAMESAIVYLTLGAILMRIADRRSTKIYCMGVAIFLTTLVGTSRILLGVHYPTDVLGGWIVGYMWASLAWIIEQQFEKPAGIAEEKKKAA